MFAGVLLSILAFSDRPVACFPRVQVLPSCTEIKVLSLFSMPFNKRFAGNTKNYGKKPLLY
jgi:hypothetical protein